MTTILPLTNRDQLTWQDGFTGILVLGASGSGKTSSSMASLLRNMAQDGAGGLIACIKADEAEHITRHLRAVGREQDILRITSDGKYRFNLLEQLLQDGQPLDQVDETVAFLSRLQIMLTGKTSHTDDFWQTNSNILIQHSLQLMILSHCPISFTHLHQIIAAAPTSAAQIDNRYWQQQSLFWKLLTSAHQQLSNTQERQAFADMKDYFCSTYANMGDKTRSSIQLTVLSLISKLLNGLLRHLFDTSDAPTLHLEDSLNDGKIILMDLSPRIHGEAGKIAQFLLKDRWQQIALARTITKNSKPSFLLIDEAQILISGLDADFLAEARSSKIATIFATQSIVNFKRSAGTQSDGESLLSLFNNFIFHNNSDLLTNNFASTLCGYEEGIQENFHTDTQGNVSLSAHQSLLPFVAPHEFSRLTRGGAPHFYAEAIIYKAGTLWFSGKPTLRAKLAQQIDGKTHEITQEIRQTSSTEQILYTAEAAESGQTSRIDADQWLTVATYLMEIPFAVKNPAYLLRYVWEAVIPRERDGKKRALQTLLRRINPPSSTHEKQVNTQSHTQYEIKTRYPVPLTDEPITSRPKKMKLWQRLASLLLLMMVFWLVWHSLGVTPT
ncbi:MAG: type IV secretory system conjugative DNA transfer family protein [Chloroflexota bacterium]